ncbi:Fanconi anemia group I protein-like [Penaeus chinensis]|uniref:Fanconi anemia group I protein-like n=1 Tax=Penaeus chinensis TaxID=139456 RepID=UPI001FB7622D|nr:Fanconi anemia group I protein-like [Penaeus chinensis]
MSGKLRQHVRELIDQKEWKELEDLLLNTEDEWIMEILERLTRSSEGPKMVGGLLMSLSCDTRESTSLRLKIYEYILERVRTNEDNNKRGAGEMVGVLMMHVDVFPNNVIIKLVNHYVEHVQNGSSLQGRWVDLLAKLITSLSQKEEITVSGKEMSGEDYRYQVLKSFCDLPWSAETTISLLPVFRDIDLPKEELQDVVYKVEHVLKSVDFQSVPPIIYHLILLVKGKLPGRVLQAVIDFFNKQEQSLASRKENGNCENDSIDIDSEVIEESKHSELTEAQGTVILHVTHQAQYNPALVKDYLKFVKTSTWLTERLITPFNLALSLSLASIEKYQDQIIESLKSCLLKSFRQQERSRQSQWLRETWGDNCNITAAFRTTIDNCIMGWDQVSQGLVQLGFSLLESGGGPKGETYASQRAVELASVILPLILKKQPHIARTVISQLSNFILSASSPLQYIDILGKLAKVSPLVMLEHLNLIRELLEYLVFLPLPVATHLLHALLPLLKMSMTLKDALMITLRKMLFSKQVESRQVAVRGFLQFLRHFRVMGTLPSSQASMSFSSSLSTVSINADVHSVFNNSTNEALCLELLGVLRRCFSQQHEVKSTFYAGLYDVSRANPKLTVSILELLLQHIKIFLDMRADIFNPIILKKLISVQGENAVLIEPMGDLLGSLGAIKTYYEENRDRITTEDDDEEENAVSILNEVCSIFDLLTEKLAGCGLDDLGFDTNGEFSSSSAVGQKNLISAKIMISVFDCLIEHIFTHGAETSEEKMQTLISLFKSQRKIITLVKERSGKPAKKGEGSKGKGRPAAKPSVTFKSNLSLRATAKMLEVSLITLEDAEPNYCELMKENHDFQMYLLLVIEETLSSVKGLTVSERERILSELKTVAKVLLFECSVNIGTSDSSDDREVTRMRQSLQILSALLTIFCRFYKDKLESILKEVTGKTDNKDLNGNLYRVSKKCQKMLLKILHHEERAPLLKDGCLIVHLMSTVTQAMEPECDAISEVQDWVLQLCKDQALDHGGLADSMVGLAFVLSNQVKANHTLTRGIARELHHKLGDLEQDVEVEEAGKYKIVTEETASAVLTTLLSHLDDSLNLTEMALNKTKACLASGAEYDADKIERQISMKFVLVMHAVHEVIQSALPLGTNTDLTLKLVTKFYNVLSLYVKYYLDLYRIKSYPQISDKFEKVVHMSGQLVTAPVYPTITYIEGAQRQMGKNKEGTLKARAIKEYKLIPSLIFSIEQYEKHLITLSRKSKVNLMQAMKLSTSRDFRIVPAAIMEALKNDDEDPNDETEVEINGDNADEGDQNEDNAGGASGSERHSGSDDEDNTQMETKDLPTTKKDTKGAKKKRASSESEEERNENDSNSQNVKKPQAKKKKLLISKKIMGKS